MTRTLKLIGLGVVGLTLMGLAIKVIQVEAPSSAPVQSRYLALAGVSDPTAELGWSLRSQTDFLLACDDAMRGYSSLEMRYAGPEARDQIVAVCSEASDSLAASMPTNSFAFAVSAATAARQNDWPKLNAALISSAIAAPNEQWIAQARVRLAEEHYARLNEEARLAHESDLALLVRTRTGVASIARRYVGYPDFRERIIAVVEQMPNADRSRFLYNVRAAYGLQPVWRASSP